MSRRTLLTGGAVVAVGGTAAAIGRATGTLDDVLRDLGARPHPEPDPGDVRRTARAARDQALLVASIDAVRNRHRSRTADLTPLLAVAREQLTAVGGSTASVDIAAPDPDARTAVTAVAGLAERTARSREADALVAVSPDLARLLASMAGGQAQLARTLEQAA